MKVVASAIVDKYIGESARVIREMFGEASGVPLISCPPVTSLQHSTEKIVLSSPSGVQRRGSSLGGTGRSGCASVLGYAKEHQPCIIFMDEIDAIGGRRFSQGTSADREIQRTLMEVRHFVCFFLL